MCKALDGSVVVMHVPESNSSDQWRQLRKSLDELHEICTKNDIKIAVENMPFENLDGIVELFSEYGPEFIGLCYDSGHGNMGGDRLEQLDSIKDRLISVHLHDNDGQEDQHKPIFTGTVDWTKLAKILAESPNNKCITFETEIKLSGIQDEKLFLKQTYDDGLKLLKIIKESTASSIAI